jgi:hypothetical protein
MSKQPDPSAPPKDSIEEKRFKRLLRKLVAVPRDKIQDKHLEYRKTTRKQRRRSS